MQKTPPFRPMPRRRRPARGMALAGTMMVLMIIVAIMLVGSIERSQGDMTSRATQSMTSTKRRMNVAVAENLSRTGARMGAQWIFNQTGPPLNTTAFAPTSFFGATAVNNYAQITLPQGVGSPDGTISVRIYPYASNATSTRKMYVIESAGEFVGSRVFTHVVVKQNSFARYAYFSDKGISGWWVAGNTKFQGPVHINGSNAAGTGIDSAARVNIMWRNSSSTSTYRLFTYTAEDYFTTSMPASQVIWGLSTGSSWSYSAPSTQTHWFRVTAAQRAPKYDVPRIPLPPNNSDQRNAALAGQSAITTVGVQVPNSGGAATGGVYINGAVNDMNLTTSGTGDTTQIMTVLQVDGSNDVRTTITMNRSAGTISTQRDTKPTTGSTWALGTVQNFTGDTNGVVFVNGSIGGTGSLGGLSGVVANNVMSGSVVTKANSLQICTDASQRVYIDGSIIYRDLRSSSTNVNNQTSNSSAATSTSGILGIVSDRINVEVNDGGGAAFTDFSLHATVLAKTSFDIDGFDTRASGNFKLIGGLICGQNGSFGTTDPNTGAIRTGFLANRNYDQRVADSPPPFFPSAGTSYQITSMKRASGPLQ